MSKTDLLTRSHSNHYQPVELLERKSIYLQIALIVGLTSLAYAPVLFNFFLGDDFVHLQWLSQAVHNPDLLLRNFNHSWLEVPTTKFYRPLISVFMFTDYLGWGTNGLGFHITNVLFHIVNSVFVFLIGRQLITSIEPKEKESWQNIWPFAAGLLFGLYPLHPEPVSWITGRVDTIVTTFYLAAVWCYIQWRHHIRYQYLIAAGISMVLALLSKEMAITIPALLLTYDVIFPDDFQMALSERLKFAIKNTALFWSLLAIYFLVRRLALGTFIGGYDDSLFFISNWREFLHGWFSGIAMLIVPANNLVIGNRNLARIAWEIAIFVSGVFLLLSILKGKRRPILFLLLWLMLSLAPVYKIFSIAVDLQGSRLAYLLTVPFSLLLTYGLSCARLVGNGQAQSVLSATDKGKASVVLKTRQGALVLFMVSAFCLLWQNNQVWRRAGQEMNSIRSSLTHIYAETPGDPQTLLIGMPDEVNGAYLGRNAVPGMLQQPQFPRTITNCLFFDSSLPILPFGYLKDSLEEAASQVKIYFWNRGINSWQKIILPRAERGGDPSLDLSLFRINNKIDGGPNGTKEVDHQSELSLPAGARISCLNAEFLFVAVDGNEAPNTVLEYENSLSLHERQLNRVQGQPFSYNNRRGLLFPLRANPVWAFGGLATHLRLQAKTSLAIESAEFVPARKIMPLICFANSGYLGTKGFLHFSSKQPSVKVTCYRNDVPGAAGFSLVIMRPNVFLAPDQLNEARQSPPVWKQFRQNSPTGDVLLTRDMFQSAGIYQARVWALDAQGNRIGVAGDHINISIE